jgi:curved DNA-binding protein CbpA
MRRIAPYRKLFNATKDTTLADLKLTYRSLIKEWHPDKIIDDEARKTEAELKSKKIIEAYHFLVSINTETHIANAEEYTRITNTATIHDVEYKNENLTINFADGSAYEYLGVTKNVYTKLMNAPSISRYARRHVFNSFMYRKISKQSE